MNPVEAFRRALIGTVGTGITAARLSTDAIRKLTSLPLPTGPDAIDAWRHAVGGYLRELMDVPEHLVDSVRDHDEDEARQSVGPAGGADAVREQFAHLLNRSTDVDDHAGEPGLLDVIKALSPDEARIIRQLATNGPAATLDLFRVNLAGGAKMVLPRVCLVAQKAGCMHDDRVDVYLANLERLGVIRFSSSEVEDGTEYQLLEGMPDYKTASGLLRDEGGARPKGRKGRVELSSLGQMLAEIALGGPA